MGSKTPLVLFIFVLLCSTLCSASVSSLISNVFGDNMVLQRGPLKSNIWGWSSSPNQQIKISIGTKVYSTTSKSDASWSYTLDAFPAGGPYTITVSQEGEIATLKNVYFGDVWFCGGQSNMVMTVSQVFNSAQEIKEADDYPMIRVMTVGQRTNSSTPLKQLATIEQPWSVASSSSIGGKDWKYFSATCWFFGKELYNKYQVPVGLISSNWGGTTIQRWSSSSSLSECNATQGSDLYNAMIVPFFPMSLKGIVWYQGENNVGQSDYYSCAFPAMIKDWRMSFEQPNLPFIFVQLAAYLGPSSLPSLRLAQTSALSLPYVGMATAIDLGDPSSPYGNIHPRYKKELGRRLSLVAQGIAYDDKNVQYLGPMFKRAFISNIFAEHFLVGIEFTNASVGSGLVANTTNNCTVSSSYCGVIGEILGTDSKWHPGIVIILEGTFTITAKIPPKVHPTKVRYLWAPYPVCYLYNESNLPAYPFEGEIDSS